MDWGYCRCPDPVASLWNIGHCNLCGLVMRSHPRCKCCRALLKKASPDGQYCQSCYEDLQQEVKKFWFTVGFISDGARQWLEATGCIVRQISETPQIFLVCLLYRDRWDNEEDLIIDNGDMQVRSLALDLLWHNSGRYSDVTETRLMALSDNTGGRQLQSEQDDVDESVGGEILDLDLDVDYFAKFSDFDGVDYSAGNQPLSKSDCTSESTDALDFAEFP